MLLALARNQKVDLTRISILQLAEQYLAFITAARGLRIEIAAEYLVMAATLALIKSRMLLPSEEHEDEDQGGNPRAQLIARLLEYERYKEVAEALAQ